MSGKIVEVRFLVDGRVQKRISFVPQGKDVVVYEQDAIYSIGPTSNVTWDNTYINTFSNREYAKTSFLGLVAKAAVEEGGVTNDVLEEAEKLMYKSVSSPVGRM